ncbi:MAG: adenine phosphoribosyltransferase [Bacteroidia bacterium]|nr:adenine phosphoribosyltransferase [Bacteroidia bacterium]
MSLAEKIHAHIREVPDFPIPGVLFKDISPIFLSPELMRECKMELANRWRDSGVNKILGIDSRGFLFGPQMAEELDAGFVMIRKKGKLPPETIEMSYALEYGEATLEAVKEALQPGDKIVIHDDLLATGGTAAATAELAKKLGAEVLGFSFIIDLTFLNGQEKLKPYAEQIHSLVEY